MANPSPDLQLFQARSFACAGCHAAAGLRARWGLRQTTACGASKFIGFSVLLAVKYLPLAFCNFWYKALAASTHSCAGVAWMKSVLGFQARHKGVWQTECHLKVNRRRPETRSQEFRMELSTRRAKDRRCGIGPSTAASAVRRGRSLFGKSGPPTGDWQTERKSPCKVLGLPLVPKLRASLDGDFGGDLGKARHFLGGRVTCLVAGVIRDRTCGRLLPKKASPPNCGRPAGSGVAFFVWAGVGAAPARSALLFYGHWTNFFCAILPMDFGAKKLLQLGWRAVVGCKHWMLNIN